MAGAGLWPLMGAALAAGAMQAISLASPWDGTPKWWLQTLSMAVLVGLLRAAPARAAAAGRSPTWVAGLIGWCFATAWLVGTFWWLFISMHTYGGLAAPFAAAGVLALAGALALYYALACVCFVRMSLTKPVEQALVFGACWLLAELARGQWLTGFPWGAVGYSHVDGPLAGLAAWVGVYGVGLAASWLAVALSWGLQVRAPDNQRAPVMSAKQRQAPWVRTSPPWLFAAALLLVGGLAGRGSFGESAGRLDITLLQGNIPQDEKFLPGSGVAQALAWYGEQLGLAQTALVVAPETAIPLLPAQLPDSYWPPLLKKLSDEGRAALVGMPLGSFEEGYVNAAVGLMPGQATYQYGKHHLVPFGEFIPPLFRWFTELMAIPLGDFTRGAPVQAPMVWAGQRLAPNICYEDLFGEEIALNFANPDGAPTIMVNLSNIAWFGESIAVDQHLHISRMRSLEFQRPMVRATNTGATAVIDHRGQVAHRLAPHTRDVLVASVEGRQGQLTPYATWASAYGLWPLWGWGLASLLVAALAGRRTKPPK
jgi:apolipoprotein N-acyltransferase